MAESPVCISLHRCEASILDGSRRASVSAALEEDVYSDLYISSRQRPLSSVPFCSLAGSHGRCTLAVSIGSSTVMTVNSVHQSHNLHFFEVAIVIHCRCKAWAGVADVCPPQGESSHPVSDAHLCLPAWLIASTMPASLQCLLGPNCSAGNGSGQGSPGHQSIHQGSSHVVSMQLPPSSGSGSDSHFQRRRELAAVLAVTISS